MMLTITTILHIVLVIASFFTQETQALCTCDMKLHLAAWLIAVHTCSLDCSGSLPLLLTYVACLQIKQIELVIDWKRISHGVNTQSY